MFIILTGFGCEWVGTGNQGQCGHNSMALPLKSPQLRGESTPPPPSLSPFTSTHRCYFLSFCGSPLCYTIKSKFFWQVCHLLLGTGCI